MSSDTSRSRQRRDRYGQKYQHQRSMRVAPGNAPNACGKTAYPDEALALHVAERATAQRGCQLRVYHCPTCSGWHLTSHSEARIPPTAPPDVDLIAQYVATDACRDAGQLDKAGEPYEGHLMRVAQRVQNRGGTPEQVAAAWLHDSVEDGHLTPEQIKDYGITVYRLVDALTHRPHEPRKDYFRRIFACPGAALIKRADHDDNMNPRRFMLLPEDVRERMFAKYTKEAVWLGQGYVDA